METGETEQPVQIADMRRRSRSKHAQQRLLRFRTMPRGVKLLLCNPRPSFRASNVEEKKGKFVSTKSPQASTPAMVGEAAFSAAAAGDPALKAQNATRKAKFRMPLDAPLTLPPMVP